MPAELIPLLVAGAAAGAIILIFLGLAGSSPVDPVQGEAGSPELNVALEYCGTRLIWNRLAPFVPEAAALV